MSQIKIKLCLGVKASLLSPSSLGKLAFFISLTVHLLQVKVKGAVCYNWTARSSVQVNTEDHRFLLFAQLVVNRSFNNLIISCCCLATRGARLFSSVQPIKFSVCCQVVNASNASNASNEDVPNLHI